MTMHFLKAVGFAAVVLGAGLPAGAEEAETVERMTSPRGLTTEIRRTAAGEISEADLAQASVLAAELIRQVEQAHSASRDGGDAAAEIVKARQLVAVLRGLLPSVQTSVRVTGADGKVVYESRHVAQVDDIPVLHVHTTVDHLRPILAAKKGDAPKGLQLTHAEFLRTDVSVQLSTVDRYLAHAQRVDSPNSSVVMDLLGRAEAEGIVMQTSQDPDPLLEAREALYFAHGAARAHRYDEATKDLETALSHLKQYRDTVPRGNDAEINALVAAIAAVQVEIKAPETLEKLSRIFQKLAPHSVPVPTLKSTSK